MATKTKQQTYHEPNFTGLISLKAWCEAEGKVVFASKSAVEWWIRTNRETLTDCYFPQGGRAGALIDQELFEERVRAAVRTSAIAKAKKAEREEETK
jgi:hypothetical protein